MCHAPFNGVAVPFLLIFQLLKWSDLLINDVIDLQIAKSVQRCRVETIFKVPRPFNGLLNKQFLTAAILMKQIW
jgi:hypothetical protein